MINVNLALGTSVSSLISDTETSIIQQIKKGIKAQANICVHNKFIKQFRELEDENSDYHKLSRFIKLVWPALMSSSNLNLNIDAINFEYIEHKEFYSILLGTFGDIFHGQFEDTIDIFLNKNLDFSAMQPGTQKEYVSKTKDVLDAICNLDKTEEIKLKACSMEVPVAFDGQLKSTELM